MARLPALTPEQLDVAQRDLHQRISGGRRAEGPQHFDLQRPDGSLTGPFNAFLLSPSVGTALQSLGAALRYETGLDGRTRETAILMVAAHWGSAFEQHAHEGAARAAGLSERDLEAIKAGGHPAYHSRQEEAAGRLVRSMLDGDVDDPTWSELADVVGLGTVFELSALVGYYATLALQLRVFRADEAGSGERDARPLRWRGMADENVTRTITYRGSPALVPMLAEWLAEEGVRVKYDELQERREVGPEAVVVELVAGGGLTAMQAVVNRFREHWTGRQDVDVQIKGEPPPGHAHAEPPPRPSRMGEPTPGEPPIREQ